MLLKDFFKNFVLPREYFGTLPFTILLKFNKLDIWETLEIRVLEVIGCPE